MASHWLRVAQPLMVVANPVAEGMFRQISH